jgi:LPXTG-motif cell wall-anchored protein
VTTRVTVAADEGDRGSPVGLVAGLTVAAALGGAGALTARRRRALEGGS